jgi:uncharacterized protein YndB with AHSA1/START domain
MVSHRQEPPPMTDRSAPSIRISSLINASPQAVWDAFMDPATLLEWLPPGEMSGEMHAFDGRIGGGYEMSLHYPANEAAFVGKTTATEDRVRVRFDELDPPWRIVQAAIFDSPDPAFHGEMRMVITLEPVPGGTHVTMTHSNLPPGLRAEDDEVGSRMSLDQLARRFG